MDEAAGLCRSQGAGLQLVTPAVREGTADAAWAWLVAALESSPGAEVTFNDWGLWARAREAGLPLRGVAGRLLSRQRRGPRVAAMLDSASASGAEELRASLWDGPVGLALLSEHGAVGVELDLTPAGIQVPDLPEGVTLRVHAPWVPVTVSLACPWTEDPVRCGRPCLDHPEARLRNEEEPTPLWSRGNALFLRRDDEPTARYLVRLGADRLLWSPEIPG